MRRCLFLDIPILSRFFSSLPGCSFSDSFPPSPPHSVNHWRAPGRGPRASSLSYLRSSGDIQSPGFATARRPPHPSLQPGPGRGTAAGLSRPDRTALPGSLVRTSVSTPADHPPDFQSDKPAPPQTPHLRQWQLHASSCFQPTPGVILASSLSPTSHVGSISEACQICF